MSTADAWHATLADLVSRSHRIPPDRLSEAIDAVLGPLNVTGTAYVVDVEQELLRPLPAPGRPAPDPLPIDASLPGRAYMEVRTRSVVHN
ncbi:hypothetical protein [Micromonospora sp. NPDC003776]